MLRNDLYRPWFVGDSDWGFEIIDGEFSGTVIQIEKVEFTENTDGNVNLEYHLVKKPESMEDLDEKNELLVKVIELVVNDVLTEAINHYEQTRNNDSTKPDQQ